MWDTGDQRWCERRQSKLPAIVDDVEGATRERIINLREHNHRIECRVEKTSFEIDRNHANIVTQHLQKVILEAIVRQRSWEVPVSGRALE